MGMDIRGRGVLARLRQVGVKTDRSDEEGAVSFYLGRR
jgi:hypothetical protein